MRFISPDKPVPDVRPSVDLILLGSGEAGDWTLGRVVQIGPSVEAVRQFMKDAVGPPQGGALLFWDPVLGRPEASSIAALLEDPGDVWHAGLLLGAAGLPRAMDYVRPTWMYNRDPDPYIEVTSWRISLRACLIRLPVLQAFGALRKGFASLEAAALEFGHRIIHGGAIVRHVPGMLPNLPATPVAAALPPEDEFLFTYHRFGRKWTLWASLRALATRDLSGVKFLRGWFLLPKPRDRGLSIPAIARPPAPPARHDARVSVLIPTLERYGYLRTLLRQLSIQTVEPLEVIVVDQTPESIRDDSLEGDFPNLSLKIIHMDAPGQCSSRNAGLLQARGDYILLADDDIEPERTFIEDHLATIRAFDADSSSGIAREVGAPTSAQEKAQTQISDVFPAGVTLVSRDVLSSSGLFDLAYERGSRADGDLGMRIYLAGGLVILNTGISVLHHRAPHGGLRAHGARVTTRASSRATLTGRHLPSASEIYLIKRYFSDRQIHEATLQRAIGTLSMNGSAARRLLKALIGLALLPDTIRQIRRRTQEADRMLEEYPQIVYLSPAPEHPVSPPDVVSA